MPITFQDLLNLSQQTDDYGKFLQAAYLTGSMPGNQVSAFNTVMDLMGPSAVAERRTQMAGPGTLQETFGITPGEEEQAYMQGLGLRMTPAESAEASRGGRALDIQQLLGMGTLDVTRRGQEIGRETARETGAAQERIAGAQIAGQERIAGAQTAAQKEVAQKELDAMLARLTMEADQRGMDRNAYAFDANLKNIAMRGTDLSGAAVDPEARQIALKIVNAQRIDPYTARVAMEFIKSGDEEWQKVGYGLLNIEVSNQPGWLSRMYNTLRSPWLPESKGGLKPVQPGAPGAIDAEDQMKQRLDALTSLFGSMKQEPKK